MTAPKTHLAYCKKERCTWRAIEDETWAGRLGARHQIENRGRHPVRIRPLTEAEKANF